MIRVFIRLYLTIVGTNECETELQSWLNHSNLYVVFFAKKFYGSIKSIALMILWSIKIDIKMDWSSEHNQMVYNWTHLDVFIPRNRAIFHLKCLNRCCGILTFSWNKRPNQTFLLHLNFYLRQCSFTVYIFHRYDHNECQLLLWLPNESRSLFILQIPKLQSENGPSNKEVWPNQ